MRICLLCSIIFREYWAGVDALRRVAEKSGLDVGQLPMEYYEDGYDYNYYRSNYFTLSFCAALFCKKA